MKDGSGRPRNRRNDPAPLSTDIASFFCLLFTEFQEIIGSAVMVRNSNPFVVERPQDRLIQDDERMIFPKAPRACHVETESDSNLGKQITSSRNSGKWC